MRVWERGTGITLASGSSSCAVAVAAARRGLTGRRVTLDLDGGAIAIDWREDGVWMTGPTMHVFSGPSRLSSWRRSECPRKGVHFSTLGCRLNAYETEAMKALAATGSGLGDAVVVNTCAVTAEAVRQSTPRHPAAAARKPRGQDLIVTGCAAQTDPDGFSAKWTRWTMSSAMPRRWSPPPGQRLPPDDIGRPVQVNDIMSTREDRRASDRRVWDPVAGLCAGPERL